MRASGSFALATGAGKGVYIHSRVIAAVLLLGGHRQIYVCRRSFGFSMSAKLGRFSLAKPRNTLVSAVSSFTPARRCLLGVADGLTAQSQLKCLGNAVVDGFVYFIASDSSTSQLMLITS